MSKKDSSRQSLFMCYVHCKTLDQEVDYEQMLKYHIVLKLSCYHKLQPHISISFEVFPRILLVLTMFPLPMSLGMSNIWHCSDHFTNSSRSSNLGRQYQRPYNIQKRSIGGTREITAPL